MALAEKVAICILVEKRFHFSTTMSKKKEGERKMS